MDKKETNRMTLIKSLSAAALAFGAALAISSASAAPLGQLGGAEPANSALVRVHGCHYECRWSPGLGWHNHSNAECRPEPCRGGGYGGGGYNPGACYGPRPQRGPAHCWVCDRGRWSWICRS